MSRSGIYNVQLEFSCKAVYCGASAGTKPLPHLSKLPSFSSYAGLYRGVEVPDEAKDVLSMDTPFPFSDVPLIMVDLSIELEVCNDPFG